MKVVLKMTKTLLALALTLIASQAFAQSRPYYDTTYYDSTRAHCQALDDRLPGLECLDPTVSARSSTSGNRYTTYEKTFGKNCFVKGAPSPSIRNDVALIRSAASTMAGKRSAQSRPLRVKQRTRAPSRRTIKR